MSELMDAVRSGDIEAVRRILGQDPAAVNERAPGGETPLHIAAENGMADIVRILLAAGADAHAVDAGENTPLSRAAAKNQSRIVDLINDPE